MTTRPRGREPSPSLRGTNADSPPPLALSQSPGSGSATARSAICAEVPVLPRCGSDGRRGNQCRSSSIAVVRRSRLARSFGLEARGRSAGGDSASNGISGRWPIAAWLILFSDSCDGRIMCFDDGVGAVVLDDRLDLDDFVSRHDREATRMCPHGLIFGTRQEDELVAAELAAFAAKGDRFHDSISPHGLIDSAQEDLVDRYPPLGSVIADHAWAVEGEWASRCAPPSGAATSVAGSRLP